MLSSVVMAEVSRRVGAGLRGLYSQIRRDQLNHPPGGRGALESMAAGAEQSCGRRGGPDEGTGTGVRSETSQCLQLPPHPEAGLLLSDPAQALISDLNGPLLPARPRMLCWDRSVFLTPLRSQRQKMEDLHRTYCTLLLLTDGPLRCPPQVTVLLSRHLSDNYNRDAALHRSRTAYYDILQVSPNATQVQIKTAYYKQSFLYHPDKNAGSDEATQRFAQISEAYSVLGSVGLRKKYDRGILSPSDVQGAGRPSGKDTSDSSRSQGPQQQGPRRSYQSPSTNIGGKPMFDFDAFYQAHYGEQLQREQAMRRWKKNAEQMQEKDFKTWKLGKMMEVLVGVLLALGVSILFSIKS